MPRVSPISDEELQGVIDKYKVQFIRNLNTFSAKIWKDVSTLLHEKITAKALYTRVKKYFCKFAGDVSANISDTEDSTDIQEEELLDFTIYLSYESWIKINPDNGNRLKYGWTNVLNKELINNKISEDCVWGFKNSYISKLQPGKFFLVTGQWTECNANINIQCSNKPCENTALELHVSIFNLKKQLHSKIKRRHISGELRMEYKKRMQYQSAINVLRQESLNGDTNILPSLEVLRKCKSEAILEKYEQLIDSSIKDPIMRLHALKYTQEYGEIIHDIGLDHFFLHYWGNDQLHVYNEYVKTAEVSKLAIDATAKTNLINHNKIHRGKFKCKECGKLFLRHSLLTVHLRVHGIGEKKYGCNECYMKYYGKSLLEVHKRTHTGERPLKCPECEKCFALPRSLSAHYLIHTGEKKHVCGVCLKAFSHSQSLVSHRRVHTGERPYVCSVCGLTFKASGQLQIHSRTHTNEKPYACTLCDKSFNSGSSLAVHLRRHGEDRTYLCTTCRKSFKTKIDLTVHFRSHTGEKPYSCKVSGCEKKYRTQSHLSVHLRSHTGEKNYNCKVCSKSFVTSAVLKKHMFIHEGIKRYECAVCGHRFTQGSTLKTHMKTHQKAANT